MRRSANWATKTVAEKLKTYGAGRQVHNLFKKLLRNYAKELHQVANFHAQFKRIKNGVPQGSMLGPLINNLAQVIQMTQKYSTEKDWRLRIIFISGYF